MRLNEKDHSAAQITGKPGSGDYPAGVRLSIGAGCEAAGFKAVLMAAGLTGDAQLGMPNLGLATASEIINCAKYIAHSVNIRSSSGWKTAGAARWLPTAPCRRSSGPVAAGCT